MILYNGKLMPSGEQSAAIERLREDIPQILALGQPVRDWVVDACDRLAQRAALGEYDEVARPILEMAHISDDTFAYYISMFKRENLQRKIETELGALSKVTSGFGAHRKLLPLGVLFHIAAGNVDALPAYSVVEGLLAGNINILKLPSGDNGLSVLLMQELIKAEPRLAPYIYVFDVPSTEVESMRRLASLASAVVVWGGDEAVRAARNMAEPNTAVISWGHKLSFAYAGVDVTDDELELLAEEICNTNQLLCSSPQGIFYDSESEDEAREFAKRFLAILAKKSRELGEVGIGMRAKSALLLYNEVLCGNENVYKSGGVSVIYYSDSELTLSYLYRNVYVKRLPKSKILSTLWHKKGYLQTCAVLGFKEGREEVCELLARCGLTHISRADASRLRMGYAHDGAYPLALYTRIVDIDG